VPFTWFGLVLGISVLETPLKFRAPRMTPALGLGVGRLVFRALKAAELVLAVPRWARSSHWPRSRREASGAGIGLPTTGKFDGRCLSAMDMPWGPAGTASLR
jgi:hypothetical protein